MEGKTEPKRSMAPVGSADARLLILGSLPGERSLAAQRYYAHPTNHFWPLIGAVLGEPLADLDYEARLARLAARCVALWDVVGAATRQGSLDGAIRGVEANPLAAFVAGHPRLQAVAFNGKTAARIGRRVLRDRDGLTFIDLPSSSAALTIGLDAKLASWKRLTSVLAAP